MIQTATKPPATREEAFAAVPHVTERLAALRPFTVYGPEYRRRVADELASARRMWETESAAAALVTAEIAAGLRPESDYPDRFDEAVWSTNPTAGQES